MYLFMPGAIPQFKEFNDLRQLTTKDDFLELSASQNKGEYKSHDRPTACFIEEHEIIFPLDAGSKESFATMV